MARGLTTRTAGRRRSHLLAITSAVGILVALGVALAVVIGPLRDAERLLAASRPDAVPTAIDAVTDASLRLLAVLPLLVLLTLASVALPLREWIRRRAEGLQNQVDPLTGTATRPAMLNHLDLALASSSRHGGTVAVLFADLDGFKRLNDEFHHDVGDHVLIEVATRLQAVARRTDQVCRFGGDEFVLVVEHLEGQPGASVVADRLLATIREPIRVGAYEFRLTASLGLALYPDASDHGIELVQLADHAMYAAKQAGGDTYRFSTMALRKDHQQRQTTLVELRGAVDDDELELAYQPQVDLRTGETVSAEALLRWRRDGDAPPVPAGRFIGLTENTELARLIGDWVLETATATAARWRYSGSGPTLAVAVNVGLRHVRHGTLVDGVREALARHALAPERLEVEIAEEAVGRDPDRVIPVLDELHRLGVRVVLDGFGGGHVPLGLLPELPVHALKLDAALTRRITGRGAGMVAGLVRLGHELGLDVVIAHVEREEQLHAARRIGCDRAQGFLIGTPVGPDEVLLAPVVSVTPEE